MAKLTYAEQLKHPKWQQRRLEVMESEGFQCANCGSEEKTLHVHHRRYVKGRMAWEYDASELVCLCNECHDDEHSAKDELEEILLSLPVEKTRAAVALLRGYVFGWERREPVDCWGTIESIGQLAWYMEESKLSDANYLIDEFVKKRGEEIESARSAGGENVAFF